MAGNVVTLESLATRDGRVRRRLLVRLGGFDDELVERRRLSRLEARLRLTVLAPALNGVSSLSIGLKVKASPSCGLEVSCVSLKLILTNSSDGLATVGDLRLERPSLLDSF